MNTRETGRIGEDIAARYLVETMGAHILARNYTVRGGELDIVAEKDGMILFVEVKLRAKDSGLDSVNLTKIRRLSRTGMMFLQKYHLTGLTARFDLAVVRPPDDVYYVERAFDYAP